MVDLGPGQKPIVMPHYPHLLAEDTEIWSAYLAAPIAPIKKVWYDVHVGQGMLLPVGASDIDKRIAAGISRKRIDAVCAVGGGYWVVEIKPFGSMLALGQAISYSRLFIRDYEPDGEVWPVVICSEVDADLVDDFEAEGVALIKV